MQKIKKIFAGLIIADYFVLNIACESSSPVLPKNGVKISTEKKVRFGGIKTPQRLMPTGFHQSASILWYTMLVTRRGVELRVTLPNRAYKHMDAFFLM